MPVQNHDSPARSPGKLFEPFAQVQFLRRKQFVAEAADLPEHRRLDKDERTGQQPPPPAGKIPQPRDEAGDQKMLVEPDGRAAGKAAAGKNLRRHVGEKSGAGMRIGVHKHQPVAGGGGGAGVAGAGDLVDRLKNDFGPGRTGDIGGAVGGIVVADDEFDRPAARREDGNGGLDFRQRGAEEFFLVEGGNDDGNFHAPKLSRRTRSPKPKVTPAARRPGLQFSSCIFGGMIFNDGMTIWILALALMAAGAGAGHRLGAIRATFSFIGIWAGIWLALPIGRLIESLLPETGAGNSLLVWILAPLTGFVIVSIAFKIAAALAHRKVEMFYKYRADERRRALWERLNARLGLCLGLANGAMYLVLCSFLIFNLTYLTTQMAAAKEQPALIKIVNRLGSDLQTTGVAKTVGVVGTLPKTYYKLADLSGLLLQNPQVGPRLAKYPALTSLWERDDMQALMQSPTVTNALASGASLGDIIHDPAVQKFFASQTQPHLVLEILQTNLDDLYTYLETGKSAKYDGEKILGQWEFNAAVTTALLRQSRPQMTANETRTAMASLTKAYSQTQLLFTGDNKLFIKNLPKFKTEAGQPATIELTGLKGEWSHGDTGYALHATASAVEKNWTATLEGSRLTLTEGNNRLVFDHAD